MTLEELRKEIDSLDEKILFLLNERMKIVKEIGKVKKLSQEELYRPEREKAIILKLSQLSEEKNYNFAEEDLAALYKEIFKISIKLEEKEK